MKALMLENHGRHQIKALTLEVKRFGNGFADVVCGQSVLTISWSNLAIIDFYGEVDTMVDMDPDTEERAIIYPLLKKYASFKAIPFKVNGVIIALHQ